LCRTHKLKQNYRVPIPGRSKKIAILRQSTWIKTELEDFARVPAYLIALLFAGRSKKIAILRQNTETRAELQSSNPWKIQEDCHIEAEHIN
jgi:hypothetical protein